jgi:predicted ATPase with chaperone activity
MISVSRSFKEIGVRRNLLEDLALKILYLVGEMSVHELARHLGLGLGMVEELFQRLRKDQLCQVTGMTGSVHRITTTSAGKSRALELLVQNQYAGPAPVSVEDYISRTRAQSVRGIMLTPKDMSSAFEHLVIDTQILDDLGTAVLSGHSIFLYGPTGTGKTSIAETLPRLFYQIKCCFLMPWRWTARSSQFMIRSFTRKWSSLQPPTMTAAGCSVAGRACWWAAS